MGLSVTQQNGTQVSQHNLYDRFGRKLDGSSSDDAETESKCN